MPREKTVHTGNQIRIRSPLNKTLESQLARNKNTSNRNCCIQQSCLLKLTNRDISRKAQTKAVHSHQAGGCVCACTCMCTCRYVHMCVEAWGQYQVFYLIAFDLIFGKGCISVNLEFKSATLAGQQIIGILLSLPSWGWNHRNYRLFCGGCEEQTPVLIFAMTEPASPGHPESCFINLLAVEKKASNEFEIKMFFEKNAEILLSSKFV